MTERPKELQRPKASSAQQAQRVAEKMHHPDRYSRIQTGNGAKSKNVTTQGFLHPTKGFGKSKRKRKQIMAAIARDRAADQG